VLSSFGLAPLITIWPNLFFKTPAIYSRSEPSTNLYITPEQINTGNKIRSIQILERRNIYEKEILTRQLAVSVSDETWKKILEATNDQEISFSSWIREAIEKKLFVEKKGERK
jgi:hypothetical protein